MGENAHLGQVILRGWRDHPCSLSILYQFSLFVKQKITRGANRCDQLHGFELGLPFLEPTLFPAAEQGMAPWTSVATRGHFGGYDRSEGQPHSLGAGPTSTRSLIYL